MESIEYFNNLNINKENDFEQHMRYLNEKIVKFTIDKYLKTIIGNNYKTDFMSIKDFSSLLTINMYSEEFKISETEKKTVDDFCKKFEYLNDKYETLNIKEYYENNIKNDVTVIKKLFHSIMKSNMNSVCDEYCKIYYNVSRLLGELEDKSIGAELEIFKDTYYSLMKQILKDETENYIKEKSKELEDNSEYDLFRKKIFLDKLENDLRGDKKNYGGVIYLIDIIRQKLCNISPLSEKYSHMKDEINNVLDINYIKQMIENEVFSSDDLVRLVSFMIKKIQEYGSDMESKKIEEWSTNLLKDKDISTNNIDKFLPKLLEDIMEKIEAVEKDVVKYRQLIYESSKELK